MTTAIEPGDQFMLPEALQVEVEVTAPSAMGQALVWEPAKIADEAKRTRGSEVRIKKTATDDHSKQVVVTGMVIELESSSPSPSLQGLIAMSKSWASQLKCSASPNNKRHALLFPSYHQHPMCFDLFIYFESMSMT